MSCNLWSKVTSVFLNINFVQKCQFWEKKLKFCEKCWFFQTIVHYYWKWISYWKTCLFSENCDFMCDCLYTSRNCQTLIKTSIFLRKCLFVHVLIFIRVFLLLENCYFDSKYDFIRWYFGQKYHFSNKILHFSWYKFFGEIEQFFEKRCQFSCQFWEKWRLVFEVI